MCSRLDSYLARSQQCLRLPVARTCKAMKYRIAIIGGGCLSARLSREEARCFVRAAAPTGDKERLSCYVWADASKVPQAFPYPGSSSRTFPLEMILTEFSGGFTALQKAAEEHLGSGKREAKKPVRMSCCFALEHPATAPTMLQGEHSGIAVIEPRDTSPARMFSSCHDCLA